MTRPFLACNVAVLLTCRAVRPGRGPASPEVPRRPGKWIPRSLCVLSELVAGGSVTERERAVLLAEWEAHLEDDAKPNTQKGPKGDT